MAKPKHITITQEGVITQEALLAYAQGRLSADETAQLEKLLRDDPFAQDALEGMRSSGAQGEMRSVITSLNVQLREKTGAREKKKKGIEIHWATYAYAAVIVGILIGLGFVMVHFIADKDQRIAMNKAVPQAQESTPVMEEKPIIMPAPDTSHVQTLTTTGGTSGTIGLADSVSVNGTAIGTTQTYAWTTPAQPDQDVSKNKQQISQGYTAVSAPTMTSAKPDPIKSTTINAGRADEVKYIANGDKLERSTNPKQNTAEKKKTQNDAVVSGAKEKKSTGKSAADAEFIIEKPMPNNSVSPMHNESLSESTPAAASSDKLKTARTLFDAADYKASAKKYNEILRDQPENPEALYFGGISDYHEGKGRQAEKNFDKLLKSNLYVDGCKWYKANVLIDKGKKEEAKQLLRDLINTNSTFKDRAVKKYEEIVK